MQVEEELGWNVDAVVAALVGFSVRDHPNRYLAARSTPRTTSPMCSIDQASGVGYHILG
jgi:hypothetical protein